MAISPLLPIYKRREQAAPFESNALKSLICPGSIVDASVSQFGLFFFWSSISPATFWLRMVLRMIQLLDADESPA
ncbi:unnamed protein product [Camellia sinensis]